MILQLSHYAMSAEVRQALLAFERNAGRMTVEEGLAWLTNQVDTLELMIWELQQQT